MRKRFRQTLSMILANNTHVIAADNLNWCGLAVPVA